MTEKSSLTSFLVCAAPKSWSKYTTCTLYKAGPSALYNMSLGLKKPELKLLDVVYHNTTHVTFIAHDVSNNTA